MYDKFYKMNDSCNLESWQNFLTIYDIDETLISHQNLSRETDMYSHSLLSLSLEFSQ